MEFRKLVGVCCLGQLAGIALSHAEPSQRSMQDRAAGKAQKRQALVEPPVVEEDDFSELNAVLLDDGYWAIAGVVGLRKDESGRTVIEVKKDGDFDRDMALTLPVPVIELEHGELVVGGIAGVSPGTDTVTLIMENVTVGTVADSSGYNGCEGAYCPRPGGGYEFCCLLTACGTSCYKRWSGHIKVCDCSIAK